MKTGGGNAGHNGLRSITAHIGNDYNRVRIGVGHPGVKDAVAHYVLHDFAKAEYEWLDPLLDAMADAAPLPGERRRRPLPVAMVASATREEEAAEEEAPAPAPRKETAKPAKAASRRASGRASAPARWPRTSRSGSRAAATRNDCLRAAMARSRVSYRNGRDHDDRAACFPGPGADRRDIPRLELRGFGASCCNRPGRNARTRRPAPG